VPPEILKLLDGDMHESKVDPILGLTVLKDYETRGPPAVSLSYKFNGFSHKIWHLVAKISWFQCEKC